MFAKNRSPSTLSSRQSSPVASTRSNSSRATGSESPADSASSNADTPEAIAARARMRATTATASNSTDWSTRTPEENVTSVNGGGGLSCESAPHAARRSSGETKSAARARLKRQ
eukprot:Amastigsp_a348753_5.p7 type:complete len:114 gc:universal Amastigsp_a348753_5:1354-1013(-)